MKSVTVDDDLRRQLANFTAPLAICDESGCVLARVFPEPDLTDYELTEPRISEEELRRRKNSDQWYTTTQVLEHLRGLDKK